MTTTVDAEADNALESFHNKNGVITNAVLIWIDIQYMTTAENIWKTQAWWMSVQVLVSQIEMILPHLIMLYIQI